MLSCAAGLIDGIIRGKDDYRLPPSMVRQLRDAGFVDELTPGLGLRLPN